MPQYAIRRVNIPARRRPTIKLTRYPQFGCAFLPAGTPVIIEENDPVSVIRGETLLGVTVTA